ncbi:MAG: hypothetical protein ABSG67_01455 [Thermoguttaceae bacterium]|jgi:hypothetical protein
MEPFQPYRLDDEGRAKRLKELTNTENPTSLEGEIAALRLLCEEALNAGQARTAMELMRVIGQLSHATEDAKFRRGELLSRVAVLSVARQFVEALSNGVAGRFDGWEEVIANVNRRVLSIVSEARNPEANEIDAAKTPE